MNSTRDPNPPVLLNKNKLSPAQYISLMLSLHLKGLVFSDRFAASFMGVLYLAELTALMKADRIFVELPEYLRIVMDLKSTLQLEPREEENNQILRSLFRLQTGYLTGELNKVRLFPILSSPDRNGVTLLQKLVYCGNTEKLSIYLKLLSSVCRFEEIEQLVLGVTPSGYNCLHGLALTGNMHVLGVYVNFIVNYFGPLKASYLLVRQSHVHTLTGQVPYYLKGSKAAPMNVFLGLLRNERVAEALYNLRAYYSGQHRQDELEDKKPPIRLSTFKSTLFFSDACLAPLINKKTKPAYNGASCLPSNLLEEDAVQPQPQALKF